VCPLYSQRAVSPERQAALRMHAGTPDCSCLKVCSKGSDRGLCSRYHLHRSSVLHTSSKPPGFQAGWMFKLFLLLLIVIFLNWQKKVVSCPPVKPGVAEPQKHERALFSPVQVAVLATDTCCFAASVVC